MHFCNITLDEHLGPAVLRFVAVSFMSVYLFVEHALCMRVDQQKYRVATHLRRSLISDNKKVKFERAR